MTEQPTPDPAIEDDDVAGHVRAMYADGQPAPDEDDDVAGHLGSPLDPKFIGSDEVDAPGLTGALKQPGER